MLLIITDTVEEKPWLNFEIPAPIHTMTMKIFAATTMSTHEGKNANASMVGTYCSARDAKNTHLSRSPIRQMSTAYTTNGQRGMTPAVPSGNPGICSPERNNIITSQNTMSL